MFEMVSPFARTLIGHSPRDCGHWMEAMQAVDELRKEADKSNQRSLAIVQKSLFQDAEGESLAVVSRQSSERRAAGRQPR